MRAITLRHALQKKPVAEDFAKAELGDPVCPKGGVLVRVLCLSLDPYVGLRLLGRHMGEPAPRPDIDPIPGAILGKVMMSDSAAAAPGAIVFSMEGGWQERAALAEGQFRKMEPGGLPLTAFLGVLGMPGLTAWSGVSRLMTIEGGETFLVDAAAGPVGGTAGQIARLRGAKRVVGIAGGPAKCAIATGAYGFDACIDYKAEGWQEALRQALPEGIDLFYENVSAEMATLALSLGKPYVQGVLCGLIGASGDGAPSSHPISAGLVIGKRARLSGLVVYDFYPCWDEFLAEAGEWVTSGRLAYHEDRADGLEAAPAHFEKLMAGRNEGKSVVVLAPEEV